MDDDVDDDDDDEDNVVANDNGDDDGYVPDVDDAVKAIRPEVMSSTMPRLRLNVTLASDPALQPYARDIKLSASQQQQVANSSGPPVDYTMPTPPTVRGGGGGGSEQQRLAGMTDEDDASQTLRIDDRDLVTPESTHNAVEPPRPTDCDADSRPLSQPPLVRTPKAPSVAPTTAPPVGQLAFTCDPCGIKFSSLSTLEAHQTYYCSHTRKVPAPDETPEVAAGLKLGGGGGRKSSGGGRNNADRLDMASMSLDVTAKVPRSTTSRLYACGQCSYSADKKVSLNRHMRMHQSSPVAAKATADVSVESVAMALADCYCSDCDIRYSSVKTYRAHKQHYCSARHRDG